MNESTLPHQLQLPTSIELRLRCNARGLDRPPQLSELIVAPKSHRQHNPHLWLLDREQTGPRKFGKRRGLLAPPRI